MVHSAFHIEPVLKKSAAKITALEVWGSKVMVATEDGVLQILQEQPGAHVVEFEVVDQRRQFAKRPVVQMQVAESLGLVVSLTTDMVQINELPSFDMSAQLLKTRGATVFALSTDISPPVLCCGAKKKLSFYRWDGSGFSEWREVAIQDTPSCISWCGDSVCVGAGRRYLLVSPADGSEKALFDSNSAPPTAFTLPGSKEMLLGRDNISVFQDSGGHPSRKYGLCWSEPPVALVFVFPYLIAVLPKVVEVQLMETQATVQSMSLRASRIAAAPGARAAFLVANNCVDVYRLRAVAMPRQVDALLEGEQYETCLALCHLCEAEAPIAAKADGVRRSYALALFAQHHFDRALALLAQSPSLDPRDTLALFPDLADPGHTPGPHVPQPPPELKGHKLLRAQVALIKYLRAVRRRLAEGVVADAGGVAAVVDSALLKALARAEPENVLAFLQQANCCDVEAGARLLDDYGMHHEMVELFRSHGEHRRALELLAQQGQGADEGRPLHGVHATVEYLQGLGAAHAPLVLEYSRWVLREDPWAGLAIFTAAAHGAAPLPTSEVLAHLRAFDEEAEARAPDGEEAAGGGSLRVAFLEHAVQAGEAGAGFHNDLVLLLLDIVLRLRARAAARGAAAGMLAERHAAGQEPGALGRMRTKLLAVLASSDSYEPEKILPKLPMVDLYEERALILSKRGDHQEALALYAHRLGDPALAQAYCARRFDPDDDASREVYLDLLKVYLRPPDGAAPMTSQAIATMSKHFSRLDAARALDELPPETPLQALHKFFESAVRQQSEHRNNLDITKALLRADHLKVSDEYQQRRSRRVVVTAGKRCKVSGAKIGTSAFAVYPNNMCVLLSENADVHVCPVTGRNFKEHPVD